MVTLDIRPKEEEKTKVAAPEIPDIDMDSSSVKDETSTWSYSMPFPGVRYYSFVRPRADETTGK
jgi:hypothetical protein